MVVVVTKKAVNLSMPTPLWDAFDALGEGRVHGRNKWALISAAFLSYLSLPEIEQRRLLGMMKAAGDDEVLLGELLAKARDGQLLGEVSEPMRLPPQPTKSAAADLTNYGRGGRKQASDPDKPSRKGQ